MQEVPKFEREEFYKKTGDILKYIENHGVQFHGPFLNYYKTKVYGSTVHKSNKLILEKHKKIFWSMFNDTEILSRGLKSKINLSGDEEFRITIRIPEKSDEYKLMNTLHQKTHNFLTGEVKKKLALIQKIKKKHNYDNKKRPREQRDITQKILNELKEIEAKELHFFNERESVLKHLIGEDSDPETLLRKLTFRSDKGSGESTEKDINMNLKIVLDHPDGYNTRFWYLGYNPITGKPRKTRINNVKDNFLGMGRFYFKGINISVGHIRPGHTNDDCKAKFSRAKVSDIYITRMEKQEEDIETEENPIENFRDFLRTMNKEEEINSPEEDEEIEEERDLNPLKRKRPEDVEDQSPIKRRKFN